MINSKQLSINTSLVRRLIQTQFPQWSDLAVRPVTQGGWDNRTFHLGEQMLVRLPSAEHYAAQVEKENRWLPILAPQLPLTIPTTLAVGEPAEGYPWKWSVYNWLAGNTAASIKIANLSEFATQLAQFLRALQSIDTAGGPEPGVHNFYRGGDLITYDAQTRQAITVLKNKINVKAITDIWETGLATTWESKPVWVHGDVSTGNLLVNEGRLSSVIDFGMLAVGDPACDLAIAWTLFNGKSREAFREALPLDANTWSRGRAWTLWKALIIVAHISETNAMAIGQSWQVIEEILADSNQNKLVTTKNKKPGR